ncbi:MAG: nucleotidyl transferase AbiEii/AbiGii toxin family protein [Chitinophagales bacterium]
MLKNTLINRLATIKIANALGELKQEVVFVGGAMVSLYIDDTAAEDIRPTKDIDLTFQITTANKLEILREKLIEKGFKQSHEEDVICRFHYDDLKVDVMSTQAVGWAPSNKWFEQGFEAAIPIRLENIEIKILTLPYFLATKMEAFFDRGVKDLYKSHDFEDIIYLFNHTSTIVEQILNTEENLKAYLQFSVKEIVNNKRILTVIPGHLYFENIDERLQLILDRMNRIIDTVN